ncbi:RNA polymerase sigma factor [Marinoscillum sp. MHG1-6]|uniref:RNA polymerase sigma factor n=1 Tax=Marinoscillum sp. MHG1-6 TaxID=2959627 RepID=UPI00215892D2|nr:sigma-70 family RNA polymerase sigma factor [Marinoscillum sp. MHG1-6]
MTESEFIKAIQAHAAIIHKITYLYLDNAEDRRDMMQEIHLQAWKSIHGFRGDARFSTWLYRIGLNTIFSYRRKKRIEVDSLEDRDFSFESPAISDEADRLMRAIKALSDVDKTIITLHLEDFDNGEIAEMTGLTKNNVGVKLHRIKDNLKKKLNPENNE